MAKTAAKNTRKSTVAAAEQVKVNHAESLEMDGIDNLLAELTAGEGEIQIEKVQAEAPGADVELTDEEADHAVSRVEAVSAAVAAAMPSGDEAPAVPSGEESDAPAQTADDSAAAPAKTPRKHYANKVDRIKDRLGAAAGEYTVLTLADAEVSDEELKNVMDSTFAIIESMNKKQKDHASQLFDFLSGKKAKMRAVHEIVLRMLNRDGAVTSGEKGNVILEMLGKPYSLGSARAMSGNAIGMMADLKLLKQDGKGKFIANPESTLLAAANAKLGLVAATA